MVLSEKGQRMRAEGPLEEPELLMQTVYEEGARQEEKLERWGRRRTKSGESKGAV